MEGYSVGVVLCFIGFGPPFLYKCLPAFSGVTHAPENGQMTRSPGIPAGFLSKTLVCYRIIQTAKGSKISVTYVESSLSEYPPFR